MQTRLAEWVGNQSEGFPALDDEEEKEVDGHPGWYAADLEGVGAVEDVDGFSVDLPVSAEET